MKIGKSLSECALYTIQKLGMLRAGDRVGVAVSGGADSVALLMLLLELREQLGTVLSVVHLNHKLRGRASQGDEQFVAKLAAKHKLAFEVRRTDVAAMAKKQKTNLEEAGRRARYEFFGSLVESGLMDKVAVGHTADDQAETVLAHILRGTGLTGLGGIHPVAGHVIRPLCEVRRTELRAYLRARKQTWREDASNRDTTKTRARIRKKLMPLLEKQFQPRVVRHLTTLADLAREDGAFLDALTEERFEQFAERRGNALRISVEHLLESKKKTKNGCGLSARLIRRMAKEVKPRAGQISAEHVHLILELAEHGGNGKALSLPGGLEIRREEDSLCFLANTSSGTVKKTLSAAYEYHIDSFGRANDVRVPELGCVFRFRVIDWPAKRVETSDIESVLDRDALRFPLVLRNWRPGDKLHPIGHRRAHKLKRLLNKKRVGRWEREGWPVLTSGGILAWTRGFPVAAEFAVRDRTAAGIVVLEEEMGARRQGVQPS